MVFDKVAWQIGSMIYSLQKEVYQDSTTYDTLFNIIRAYHFKIPSDGYSFLLKSFIKLSEVWQGFLNFADWWNYENLRKEDFLKEEYKERKTPSLKDILSAFIPFARQKNQWGIPRQITLWKEKNWYKLAETKPHNKKLYEKHLDKAEELLFQDIQEEVIIVEFVNKDKKMISFVKDKQTNGYFKYSGLINRPTVGDILKVRFNGGLQNGFNKVFTVTKCKDDVETDVLKSFEGAFEQLPNTDFGFCDHVFINPRILNDLDLSIGDYIKGTAIISYNKKKNEWGWKAIRIEKK